MFPPKPRAGSKGIDTREQINQGFVRSEIGTSADDKACRIYEAAEVDPKLLKRHAGMAEQNYVAAISCFLRALVNVKDTRSRKLLRDHINRLLLRLGFMRRLLAEADRLYNLNGGLPVFLSDRDRIKFDPNEALNRDDLREGFDEDLHDAFDMLDRNDFDDDNETANKIDSESYDTSNLLPIGTKVEVFDPYGQWVPGTISGYDKDKYHIRYPNGTEEGDVETFRVRIPQPEKIEENIPSEVEKMRVVMSEILESERQYNNDLNNLNQYYVRKLKGTAHWGGEIERSESWFSQTTLSAEEARNLFGNIEDIIQMHSEFLAQLESSFSRLEVDQSLAKDFVEWAPKFKMYADYVVRYEDAKAQVAKYRNERMGFRSADDAAHMHKVQPLAELMKRPILRTREYMVLLERLQQRTPASHPSRQDADRALAIFREVKAYMNQCINMRENRKKIRELEERFSPSIVLSDKPSRIFIMHLQMNRMEGANSKFRHILFFNDIAVCARDSEFFNRGAFRNKGIIDIHRFGDMPNFGPNALFIESRSGEKWVLVAICYDDKEIVLQKLSICTNGKIAGSTNCRLGEETQRLRSLKARKSNDQLVPMPNRDPTPPPPPPPTLMPGWVELRDPNSGKLYYFNQQLNKTQWDKPTIR